MIFAQKLGVSDYLVIFKQRLLPMQQPPLFSSLFSTQNFFSSKHPRY